jgi:hypothetical protein
MKKQNKHISWTPYTDNLKEMIMAVDTEIERSIEDLGLFKYSHLYGLKKLKGVCLKQTLFSILIWPLLSVPSLSFFCGNRLSAYIKGTANVMYDFMKRQDINWRGYRFNAAKRFYRTHRLDKETIRAAVFDDSIKHRRGKKVAATSSHFDHTLGKHVMGQQVLEMGLATAKGYLPLDSQVYVGDTKTQMGKRPLDDGRSAVGRSFSTANYSDKNQMLRDMLKRAKKMGIDFTHVIADSWFGNRDNIKAAISSKRTGIFRMKRGNLNYQYKNRNYTVTQLYAKVERRMKRLKNTSYQTAALTVQLNLSDNKNKPDWLPIKLVFSRSIRQNKENWVVFLSTDTSLTASKILEIYALRWGIEVYFKEVKQHFGFLREQTGDYAVHYASIHLCAIRFILVAHRMLVSGEAFGRIRDKFTRALELLTFARLLWELFKALIYGALDELKQMLSEETIELIKQKITVNITEFLDSALQLDDHYVVNELKAEAIGAL